MTMANITLTSAKRDAILRGLEAKRRPIHWTAGNILLAAVLAAVLTVSAFAAVSPMIREALANALGSFLAQSQPITGVAVEQDGIEIRVVSALSDSSMTRIFCEVQDKTGDRLGPEMRISGWIDGLPWAEDSSSGGTQLIAYDAETRTALVELLQSGAVLEGDTPATIHFQKFQAEESIKDGAVSVPMDILTTATLETMQTEKGETVLVPEQTPSALDGAAYIRLSSFGFGSDGRLHIQYAYLECANRENNRVLTTARSRSGKDDIVYNQNLTGATFQQNGIWYADASYSVTPDDLEDLAFDDLYGRMYVKPPVEGDWSLDITIEPAPSITLQANTQVGGARVKQVKVSAISVLVISDSKRTRLGYRPTYATLRDGTKLILTNNCVQSMGTGAVSYDQWTFDQPIDPADIVSMNFDGVTVPLQ